MAQAKQHLEALLKLSADERSAVAEALLVSLESDETDPGAEAAWAAEIERRVQEAAPGVPAERVFADIRAKLSR
jgi:putative addiction module component (TIGR02574 family)